MSIVVLVLLVVFLTLYGLSIVRSRGRIVARRGISIGADIATLEDQPQARVTAVSMMAPARVRLVVAPENGPELQFCVELHEGDFGLAVLRDWQQSGSPVAIVIPADSHLVRLRAVDSLQPLTLRRLDT